LEEGNFLIDETFRPVPFEELQLFYQEPEYKEFEACLTCSYAYLTCPIIGLEKCGKLE
jgi:hypothetical protein